MLNARLTSSTLRFVVLLLLFLVAPAIALIFAELSQRAFYTNLYFNFVSAALASTAFLQSILLLRDYSGSPRRVVRPWLLVAAGLGIWALAEVVWTTLFVLHRGPQVESPFYALWLAGYPLLLMGLWDLAQPFAAHLSEHASRRLSAASAILAATTVILAVFVVTLATLAGLPLVKGSPTGALVTLLYIFLDAALFFTALRAAAVFRLGAVGLALSLIAAGFCVFSLADLCYYVSGTFESLPADILYGAAYVLVLAGLRAQRFLVREG